MNPLVSILLPAYNCEKYIAKTIDSILAQTYSNFELLIINDGSTDKTSEIIESFTDKRVKHILNTANKGLIFTLNRGLQLAVGKYIARIDADDICLPQRIEKQVAWLEKNEHTAVVATQIICINEQGESTGDWLLDKKTATALQIKKAMVWQNCIAHPTVMMRSNILKNYAYTLKQKHSEDYDLWLQFLADGFNIEKIPEQLVEYRVHTESVTGSFHRKKNPFFTVAKTKYNFLINRICHFKIGLFEMKLFVAMLIDMAKGVGKETKKLLKP